MTRALLWTCVAIFGCGGPSAPARRPPRSGVAEAPPPPAKVAEPEPPPPILYPLAEAVADATAGPLEYIGMGPWPGVFRRFSCAYRNDRVIVIEHDCLPNDAADLRVSILSPTRGSAGIRAQAHKPIASILRADYRDLIVGSTGRPVDLALDATYDDILRHESAKKGPNPVCTTRLGQPSQCYHGLEPQTEVFDAQAKAFMDAPPPEWYQLVKALDAWDRQERTPNLEPTPENARETGAVFARALGLDVSEDGFERIGNKEGVLAPVVVLDGGHFVVAGSRRARKGDRGYKGGATVAVAVRVNEFGRPVWSANLGIGGFHEFGHAMVAKTPDGGFALMAWASKKSALHSATQIAKLSSTGKIEWEWIGKVRYFAQIATVTPEGAFRLEGHFNPPDGSDARGWRAEISPRGKLVTEDTPPEPIFGK